MRSVVVYESWFGNTKQLAEEIAGVLGEEGEVQLLTVDDPVPPLGEVDLLVVGAPTHIHGLSSKRSREGAVEQAGAGRPGIGVRGWLETLPLLGHVPVAVFDTRARKPQFLVGSAAQRVARRMQRAGYRLAVEPESFFVEGTPGPLSDGELERAGEWAASLVHEVMATA